MEFTHKLEEKVSFDSGILAREYGFTGIDGTQPVWTFWRIYK